METNREPASEELRLGDVFRFLAGERRAIRKLAEALWQRSATGESTTPAPDDVDAPNAATSSAEGP